MKFAVGRKLLKFDCTRSSAMHSQMSTYEYLCQTSDSTFLDVIGPTITCPDDMDDVMISPWLENSAVVHISADDARVIENSNNFTVEVLTQSSNVFYIQCTIKRHRFVVIEKCNLKI